MASKGEQGQGMAKIDGTTPNKRYKTVQTSFGSNGGVPSMNRRANCWENAVAESTFSRLKMELTLPRPRRV